MIQQYSDETLVQAWGLEKDSIYDLMQLIDNPYITEKRRAERLEDFRRHEQRLADLQDEMAERGMFTDEDKPRLKREFKKFLALGTHDKPRDVEE